MEEVNVDSAMAKVTSNPSFDVDKPLEELLPNPGPIPKQIESVPEEPCVEKDISGEGAPPASELLWAKTKPRSDKDVLRAARILLSMTSDKSSPPKLRGSAKFSGRLEKRRGHLNCTPLATAAFDSKKCLSISKPVTTHADHNMGQVEFLFEKTLIKSAGRDKRMVVPKDDLQGAQTLLSLESGKPNISSPPKLRGSAKFSGRLEKRRGHLNCTPLATAAFDSKKCLSISKPVTTHADHNMGQVEFLFEKALTESAIRDKRMVVPKKKADKYLAHVCPSIGTQEMIVMKDFDTGQSWEFSYRLWNREKKPMHTLQKIGAFMKAHNLQKGDLLCFYKTSEGDYVIQGKIDQ